MNTRHLVDPDLTGLIDILPALQISQANLAEIRQFEFPSAPADPVQPVTRVDHICPGADGAPDVPVLCYRPSAASGPLPVYFHIHGGGYVMGKAEDSDRANREMAARLNCAVVEVEYRLAPEHPHPAPIEDCHAALKWAFDNAESLGLDPRRMAIGGESAGGGLAAALGLLARDRGEVPVMFQLLVYPMLDDRTGTASDINPHVGEFVWPMDSNRFGWQALLGCAPGSADVSYYAAAARAPDLAGLPPTCIATAALDLFVEENLEYARRLLRAGVPTELHVYPGCFHAFNIAADAPVSRAFYRDCDAALLTAWRRVGS